MVQDPEKVGTAWRTASLRIRGAKAEIEEAGLDTEGMVESTAKLRKLIMGIAGVDILENDAKTFRSTYEIIRDISKVWNDIDDEVQKSALLEALGGKMQSNILAAVLNNGEMLENVYETAGDSLGVAIKEQEKWSQSLEASTGRVGAVLESLSAKIFDSKSLKNILESLADILEVVEKLVSKGQGLTMLGGLAGGILGGMGNGVINMNTTPQYWKDTIKNIKDFNAIGRSTALTTNQIANEQVNLATSIQSTNARLADYMVKNAGAKASTLGFIGATVKSTAAMVAQKAIMTAFNMAINAGFMIVISLAIQAITNWINKNKELQKSFQDATDRLKTENETLSDYKDKVNEIADSEEDETTKLNKLKEIKDELSKRYQKEIEDINNVTEARKLLNDEIDKEASAERNNYLAENRKAYEKAKEAEFNSRAKGFGSISYDGKLLDISKEVTDLFDSTIQNVDDFGVLKVKYNIFTFAENAEDQFEVFKKISDVYTQMSEIDRTRKDGLNKDEQWLFGKIEEEYNRLKTLLLEGESNLDDVIHTWATNEAQRLIDDYSKGWFGEDWQEQLFADVDDTFVLQAIRNILDAEEKVIAKEKEFVASHPLSTLLSDLSSIEESISDITEKIKKANEQFEDLDKVIKDNEDTEKFFSASEMIEILEKYPSLNNAIHETTYGYKIEADALEKLRSTKLEEQKTALDAELFETNARLQAAKAKIQTYKDEVSGIKDVASAKVRLAELEAKLEALSENTTNPYYNNGSLETLIGQYRDFIDASEEAEKYQEQLNKLDIELQLLGQHHKDASDSKKDETEATNKLKEANKELTDEYKKAQEAIDDLLKLTMDMIKKNKELQKDALKEQLDNFKKLIEKRKELIKLEKDQYDFEKDLKEQNRDLLEIQQELDSLSVEGADYSLEDLKRKEELQKQYIEQSEKRDDFLYDHEVETRTKALEDEEEAFEDNINTQIKAIEDYLKYEGRIRSDAVDLINGKTQAFYNDLVNYTMDYTDKSRFEFDKLWTDAYAALEKYGNGQIDVDMTLAFLIGRLKELENELTEIEKTANSTKHSVSDMAKDAAEEVGKLESRLVHVAELISKFGNPPTLKISDMNSIGSLMNANAAYGEWMKNVKAYHTGGIVEGISTKNGEVLAKLLSGEVVVTQQQTDNFLKKTLPQLATSGVANNQFAPVINLGDINISGNADQSVIDKLKAVQKDIADSVLKAVNNQTNIYNGGRVRFV